MSVIIAVIIIVLGWHGAMVVANLAVDGVATIVGLVLFARAARASGRILAMREACSGRPNWRERRLLASGLKLAIRQTEFRSLFPQIALRCERILGIAALSF